MRQSKLHALIRKVVPLLLQLYKNSFSLFFGPCCRFVPSCSSYSSLAIQRFGIVKGVSLSAKRICKCHPFHPGGYDPVPEVNENS